MLQRNVFRRLQQQGSDTGASSLELVIVTPLLIVMILVVVALGRFSHGRQLVDQAAAAGARAASSSGVEALAEDRAREAAADSLAQAGIACTEFSVEVDTSQYRSGGSVGVVVNCVADLSDLALAGVPGAVTVTSNQARSALETYRDIR